MPNWTLTFVDGNKYNCNVTHYKKDNRNVVLSFAIQYADGDYDVFVLSPTHRHKEVNTMVKVAANVITGSTGATAGHKIGSAKGKLGGIVGAGLGILISVLATKAKEDLFDNEIIDDGDYYDSQGNIAVRGLLTLK